MRASSETELLRGVACLDLAYWGFACPRRPVGWDNGMARHWPN
jgi:hypothetical protein